VGSEVRGGFVGVDVAEGVEEGFDVGVGVTSDVGLELGEGL
jgi:hypothetical protein